MKTSHDLPWISRPTFNVYAKSGFRWLLVFATDNPQLLAEHVSAGLRAHQRFRIIPT